MKVMLDECITQKCSHTIIEYLKLLNPPVEAHFLVDFLGKQGALDGDWSKLLTPPTDWLVISGDSGRGGPRIHAKGPPLHLILPQRQIVGFYLSGKSLTQCGGAERARIIISKLPDIARLFPKATPGQRFRIKRTSPTAVAIEEWPLSR